MNTIKNRQSYFSLAITLLLIIILTIYRFEFYPYHNTLTYDNFGYYLYLPSNFIYHDPGLERINDWLLPLIEKYKSTPTLYQFNSIGDYNVIRYPVGQAILYSPWFFIAHILATISGLPADGFSEIYQNMIAWGCFLYLVIGLIITRKALQVLFSDRIVGFMMILLTFGVNLHAYSGTSSPHETLFMLYASMLYITVKRKSYYNLKFWCIASFITGLATITRPTDIVIGILPLLWGIQNFKEFGQTLKGFFTSKLFVLLVSLSIFLLTLIPLLLYWKMYVGKWIYFSYANPGEGLDLLSPYTIKFLFSFRKGWFIYSPIMLISALSFILLFKKRKDIFFPLITFYGLNLYLISSWTCWWYAETYGSRPMVQSLAISLIPLGFLLQHLEAKKIIYRITIYTVLLLLLFLNLFQTWQFHNSILPTDRMTAEAYSYIFLKTKIKYETRESMLLVNRNTNEKLIPDIQNYNKETIGLRDYEEMYNPMWRKLLSDSIAHNGLYSLKLDTTYRFSSSINRKFYQITNNYYCWIKASGWVYTTKPITENPFSLVVTFTHNEKAYKYKTATILPENIQPFQWNYIETYYLTPEVRSKSDKLAVYIWLRGNSPIWVDDIRVDSYNLN